MRKKRNSATIFFLGLSGLLFLLSAYMLFNYYGSGYLDTRHFSAIGLGPFSKTVTEEVAEDPFFPDVIALRANNPDTIGMLKIEDTSIYYPVMQTKDDPEFYLCHNFDKKYSSRGLPFADYRCSVGKPLTNLMIYGHNMKDGSIFADLLKYRQKEFYETHRIISFYTEHEKIDYEIIAVILTRANRINDDIAGSPGLRMDTAEAFQEFVQDMKSRSLYETDVSHSGGDTLITLLTCEYSADNGRLVVIGRKQS